MQRDDVKTPEGCNLRGVATRDHADRLRAYAGPAHGSPSNGHPVGAQGAGAAGVAGTGSVPLEGLHAARALPTCRALDGSESEASGLPMSKGWVMPERGAAGKESESGEVRGRGQAKP